MPIGAAVLGGSAISALSANKAAKAQESAARNTVELQREVYDETSGKLQPFLGAGENALAAYMYELGLGPAPTMGGVQNNYSINETAIPAQYSTDVPGYEHIWKKTADASTAYNVGDQRFGSREDAQAWIDAQPESGGTQYQGISMSPASNFLLSQGRDTIEAGASGGGLYSGATLKGLEGYRQNVASTDRDSQLNRLLGLVQGGQSAAAGQGAAGANFANSAGSAMLQGGNAKAAGYMGVGNAFNDGIGNYVGYQNFNNMLAAV